MSESRINRASGRALLLASSVTLLTIVIGLLLPHKRPETDEGTLAHIFQIAAVASATTMLIFLATADWRAPAAVARRLALPVVFLAVAFGALYYFEHMR